MNPETHPDAAALRSDIDHTRQRMDATIDALGERFQPRHLLDEALGYLRQNHTTLTQPLNAMRDKLSHQADAAMHAVVDTVKQNPLPLLLMGAGVAWMVYNRRHPARDDRYAQHYAEDYPPSFRGTIHYDPDAYADRPLEFRPQGLDGGQGAADGAASSLAQAREYVQDAAHTAREKLSHAGEIAREKFEAARERAGEMGHRVRERTGEMYVRAREGVSHTVEAHPLETGLICLAAGVLAGLAIPTPAPVSRRLGPVVDRLRDRAYTTAEEALQAGRRATQAAVAAAKEEIRPAAAAAERAVSGDGALTQPSATGTAGGAPTGPTVSVSPSS